MRGFLAAMLAALSFVAVSFGCERTERGESNLGDARVEISRVGDAVLTAEDLDLVAGNESYSPGLEDRRAFVKRWVDTQVLYQEALRRGLRDDPAIKARLRELETELLANYFVFMELSKRAAVSDREIEDYFLAHEQEFRNEYRVSQILVATREEAERAKEMLAKKSFEEVARKMSIGENARRGGDLGYLSRGNMMPELEAVIFSMKPGEISDIIESPLGYHIFKLVDVREALVGIGLEEVREQIQNELMLAKRRAPRFPESQSLYLL